MMKHIMQVLLCAVMVAHIRAGEAADVKRKADFQVTVLFSDRDVAYYQLPLNLDGSADTVSALKAAAATGIQAGRLKKQFPSADNSWPQTVYSDHLSVVLEKPHCCFPRNRWLNSQIRVPQNSESVQKLLTAHPTAMFYLRFETRGHAQNRS